MITSEFFSVPWFIQGCLVLWVLIRATIPVAENSGVGALGFILTIVFCLVAAAACVPLMLWALFSGQFLAGIVAVILGAAPFCCVSACAAAARQAGGVHGGEDQPREDESPR